MSRLLDLTQSKAPIDMMMNEALACRDLLEETLQAIGLQNRNEETRYVSHQVLVLLSEQHPELLYSRWDCLAALLRAPRAHPKFNAIYILANLAGIDVDNRFDGLFRDYFDLLDDESVVVAAHTAANAGKIARSRPDLRSRITRELTHVDGTRLAPERRELVKGYAIQSLSEYFDQTQDRAGILEFVTQQLKSTSPKTRKLAKEFLRNARAVDPAASQGPSITAGE